MPQFGTSQNRSDGQSATHVACVPSASITYLVTRDVALATYGVPGVAQFAGPRIGCRRFSSFGYGLDLAAMCLRG